MQRKGGCCRSFQRGTLRALNYLLAIIGVLVVAYALFMYVQWSDASPSSPDDTPGPAPSDGSTPTYPWFIWVSGGAGAFVFLTASIGILSADCAGCGVTCFLGLYHALMGILLLLQCSVVCFYFFDKSWEQDLPADTTGEYQKFIKLVDHHLHVCKIVGLCTLGVQLLALLISCSVYVQERSPQGLEYSTLRDHEFESASQASYPPTSSRVAHAIGGTMGPGSVAPSHHGPWNNRIASKYAPTADESVARGYAGHDSTIAQPILPTDDTQDNKGCSLM